MLFSNCDPSSKSSRTQPLQPLARLAIPESGRSPSKPEDHSPISNLRGAMQVQGLMDIFDREWCNLYIWTPKGGSGLYHIPRDRRYWADCFVVLADFW